LADDRVFVFDACAFIALLEDEPGAAAVEVLLQDPRNRCLIHSINACEIYYDLYRRGNTEDANSLVAIFGENGLQLVEESPSDLWQIAGKLKAEWRRISLADCFALALAIYENGTLVTSDHHELDRLAQLCPILFIR
jgi:predicted nucleic acid-binding protein